MNIADAIAFANERLKDASVKETLRDAKLLLAWSIDKNSTFLIAHPEYELARTEKDTFVTAVARRAEHVPIQHITGKQEFFGMTFEVSPDVLIPRPETEIIVERAIGHLQRVAKPTFCEIGLGSGCISIAVLNNVQDAAAVGVDLSDAAIDIARRNAVSLGVAERLDIRRSDLFENVAEDSFDAVLSNPPYISLDEYNDLDREVIRYEPKLALTDGGDGLSLIKKIIIGAGHKLRSGGVLILEFGFGQAESVKYFMDDVAALTWLRYELVNDLQGIPRTLVATRG